MKTQAASMLVGAALIALATVPSAAQQRPAEDGETLFTTTYKCYACHGYDAQTGQPRLVPLNYTREGFITFVQSSPLPLMPAYPDVPDEHLGAIYDYIRSIPVDAPAIADLPLLQQIADGKADALADPRGD